MQLNEIEESEEGETTDLVRLLMIMDIKGSK